MMVSTLAELEARVKALEDAVFTNNPPPLVPDEGDQHEEKPAKKDKKH